MTNGKVNKDDWIYKIESVLEKLGLTDKVTIMVSKSKKGNDYRKPHLGMWRYLSDHLSSSDAIPDTNVSVYVGDAAGRPKRKSTKKDFSCTDYKFALNVGHGITFMTPEQCFYNSKEPYDCVSELNCNLGFQPKKHWKAFVNRPIEIIPEAIEEVLMSPSFLTQEMIVIVGSPASGKSSFVNQFLLKDNKKFKKPIEYVHVNQDKLKTKSKCINVTKQNLNNGKSVVIDNTNRDVKTRGEYIAIAKEAGVFCRCIWFVTTKEESFHLNAFRNVAGEASGDEEKRTVPAVAIHGFYKNLVPPCKSEGFEDVVQIPFMPGPFDSIERRDLFFQYME